MLISAQHSTVIPSKLITKLGNLEITNSLCFLTNRLQYVRSGHNHHHYTQYWCTTGLSAEPIPVLFTYDCMSMYGSNSIIVCS